MSTIGELFTSDRKSSDKEPQRYEEAYGKEKWHTMTITKMDSILENHIWNLVQLLVDEKVIGYKLIYKTNYKFDGTMDKYRAQIVPKGIHRNRVLTKVVEHGVQWEKESHFPKNPGSGTSQDYFLYNIF